MANMQIDIKIKNITEKTPNNICRLEKLNSDLMFGKRSSQSNVINLRLQKF